MNWETFQKLESIKHNADLDVDDIIWLDINNIFSYEKKEFVQVVCDTRCGNDEFMGFTEQLDGSSKRISWTNADTFKIVGKMLHANSE